MKRTRRRIVGVILVMLSAGCDLLLEIDRSAMLRADADDTGDDEDAEAGDDASDGADDGEAGDHGDAGDDIDAFDASNAPDVFDGSNLLDASDANVGPRDASADGDADP